ncbi:hypothetical protein C8Q74DRAFT_1439388 [Fomes fomentarius]|nr:hypothetical protein C8Q74DRAFT_1439388 [Fomes fomentarius]
MFLFDVHFGSPKFSRYPHYSSIFFDNRQRNAPVSTLEYPRYNSASRLGSDLVVGAVTSTLVTGPLAACSKDPTIPVMTTLDETMGAMFLGVVLCSALWGVSFMQAFHYFTHYTDDALHLKALFIAVFITETIHQASLFSSLGLPIPPCDIGAYSSSVELYAYLITHFGDNAALQRIERALVVEVFFAAITASLVQSFYVSRIWRLCERRRYLLIFMIALIVSQFAVSLVYSIGALALSTFDELNNLDAYAITMNATAAAADVAIAAVMCRLLHIHKSGLKRYRFLTLRLLKCAMCRLTSRIIRSDRMVNKMIYITVNTGLLTSACACIALVTHLALRDSFVYICFFFLIGRLYSNSLFANLNARKRLRDDLAVSASDISTMQLHNMPAGQVENENPYLYQTTTKRREAEVVISGTSDEV